MKFTTLNTLGLLLALLLTGPADSQAQAGPGRHHGPDTPARREIQAYYQQQVLPAVRQQRQLLEPQLAADDRADLVRYRSQLKDLRQRGQALHEYLRVQRSTAAPAQPQLSDAQREQLGQLRAESRAIMSKVAELAEQYEAAIAPLLQALEPRKRQWSAEVQAIIGKHATPEQQARLSQHGRHHGLGRELRPTMFLLLDPAATAPQPALGTTVYPNPTVATSQIDYHVAKAGAVTIELLDASGARLRNVAQETSQAAGPHTQQVDVSSLPKGTYYYKIITRAGTETKRFVKE
jgi:hypothetical protein